MDRELRSSASTPGARADPAVDCGNWAARECRRVRAEALIHAIRVSAGHGTNAGLPGRAAETLAGGEGRGDGNAVEDPGGSWPDWNHRADLWGTDFNVRSIPGTGCIAGISQ